MTINDLIVLRAIFIEELYNAIMNKKINKVKEIAEIKCKTDIEINNELCDKSGRLGDKYYIDNIDIDICYNELSKAIKEDLRWAY